MKWKKILMQIKLFYRRKRIYVWICIIIILLCDCLVGWFQYCDALNGSKDNYFVFNRLCNYYRNVYKSYQLLNTEDKKNYTPYIPSWQTFFTGKSAYFPFLWHDKEYLIPCSGTINYIRKKLFKRNAEYLLFDMNDVPEQIRMSPDTIIIAEPFSQKGKRRVLTVKNLNSGTGTLMDEKDFQSQARKQHWALKIKNPPENIIIPEWEGSFQYELNLIDGLFEKKLPVRNQNQTK